MKNLLVVLALISHQLAFSKSVLMLADSNAPIIISNHTRIEYGIADEQLVKIVDLYSAPNSTAKYRKNLVKEISDGLNNLSTAEKELDSISPITQKKLKIDNNLPLINALEWYLFTRGPNSPIIISSGAVEVWYGISRVAFRKLVSLLETQKMSIVDKQKTIFDQAQKIRSLLDELKLRPDFGFYQKEAVRLLNEGKLTEAEDLLKKAYLMSAQINADAAYALAQIREINFKHKEATPLYQIMALQFPTNPKYLLAYADNLSKVGDFKLSEYYYHVLLTQLRDSLSSHSQNFKSVIFTRLGDLSLEAGAFDCAVEFYEKALHIDTLLNGSFNPKTADLFSRIGVAWKEKSELDRALIYFQKALEIDQAYPDHTAGQLLSRLIAMAEFWRIAGDYECALEYLEKATILLGDSISSKKMESAAVYLNMGMVYHDRGDLDLARKYYTLSFQIDTAIYQGPHPELVRIFNAIGTLYYDTDEPDSALYFYQLALDIYHKFNIADNLHALILNNMAVIHDEKGEYKRAIQYYKEAVSIDSFVIGVNHIDVACIFSNIATSYNNEGLYKQALYYNFRALQVDTSNFIPFHPRVAVDYNNIGATYYRLNELEKAIYFYKKAINIDENYFGKFDLTTALRYNNLGEAYRKMGRLDSAFAYVYTAFVIDSTLLKPDNPRLSIRLNNLANIERNRGNCTKALELLEKSIQIAIINYPNGHALLGRYYKNYGETFFFNGDLSMGKTYLEKGVRMSLKFLNEDHLLILEASDLLGKVNFGLGHLAFQSNNLEVALELFEASRQNYTTLCDSHNQGIVLYNIGTILLRENEFDKAIQVFNEAVTLLEGNMADTVIYPENLQIISGHTPYKLDRFCLKSNKSATLQHLILHERSVCYREKKDWLKYYRACFDLYKKTRRA